MKKVKKNRLIINTLMLSTLSIGLTLSLTACSNTLNTLKDKSIFNEFNEKLLDPSSPLGDYKTDISSLVLRAVKSTNGQSEAISYLGSWVALKIIDQLVKSEEQQGSQKKHTNAYNAEMEKEDKDYDELVKSYQKQYKDAWELKFQQEILDPAGGTKESYLNNKKQSWAVSYLSQFLFKNFYLGLFDGSDNLIASPSETQLMGIFDSSKNIKYKFDAKTISDSFPDSTDQNNSTKAKLIDQIAARYQQIAFDSWVQMENPYVINMSLWKYGTPASGMSKYYTNAKDTVSSGSGSKSVRDGENGGEGGGDSSTTTTASGSYIYPYFEQNRTSNVQPSTTQKFTKFLETSKTNSNFLIDMPTDSSTSGTATKNTYGLKYIDNEFTEDSSTFILAKNSTIYKDLYAEFAAASMYLYSQAFPQYTNTTKQPQTLFTANNNIVKDMDQTLTTNFTSNFDPIMQQFFTESQMQDTQTTAKSIERQIKLGQTYINNLFQANSGFRVNAADASKNLFAIDAFVPGNKTTATTKKSDLSDFMFLRNTAGVHAISIDGDKYIKGTATNLDLPKTYEGVKKRSGDVVVYHYFKDKNKFKNTFKVNLNTEISNFSNNNLNMLLILYGLQDTTIKAELSKDNKLIPWIKELLKLNFVRKQYGNINEFNKTMFRTKSSYLNNIGPVNNSQNSVYYNGLASPWVFNSIDKSTTNQQNLYNFEFGKLTSSLLDEQKEFEDIQKSFDTASSNLFSSLKYKSLERNNFSQYSQYIYTDKEFVNRLLLSYLNTSNEVTLLKSAILYNFLTKQPAAKQNTQFVTSIKNAFNNYFYNKSISTAVDNDRWLYYSAFTNQSNSPFVYQNTSSTFNKDNLFNYRKKYWSYSSSLISDNINSQIYDQLLIGLTYKYLSENNFEKLMEYLQETISYGKEAYIVWANSYNEQFEPATSGSSTPATPKEVSDLLSSTNLKQNINNSFESVYYGKTGDLSAQEVGSNIGTDSTFNSNENYFTIVGDKLGFYGLQTAASNSLPAPVVKKLFEEVYSGDNKQGLLYEYGSTKTDGLNNIVNIIKNMGSVNEVETFLKKLSKSIPFLDVNKVVSEIKKSQLDGIKKVFIQEIEGLKTNTSLTDDFFQNNSGYIGDKQVTTGSSTPTKVLSFVDPDNNIIRHGAFAVQINNKDVSQGFDAFKTFIGQKINGTNTSANNDANTIDVIANLMYKIASDSVIQQKALKAYAQEKDNKSPLPKVEKVYDVRIYNELDYVWLKNWKQK